MNDPWADILGGLDPQAGETLPSARSFRTLPEPDDPPIWKGTVKTQFDLRQLAIQNEGRQPQDAVFISGYSDASLHHATGRAGWGIWMRDTSTRILRCGPCPKWAKTSNAVELCAVYAAVFTAVSNLDAQGSDILIIKTDSQHVAYQFGWAGGMRKKPKNPRVVDLLYRSYRLAEDAGLKLIVRWVKGHRGSKDTSAYLNTQADKMAREAMQTQRSWKKIIPVEQP